MSSNIVLVLIVTLSFLGCASDVQVTRERPPSDPPGWEIWVDGVGAVVLTERIRIVDARTGSLGLSVGGRSRTLVVGADPERRVIHYTLRDGLSGEDLWFQSYELVNDRSLRVVERSGSVGLSWLREETGDRNWRETYHAIGVDVPDFVATLDESDRVDDQRKTFAEWLPPEVVDAVYDNVDGEVVNRLSRFLMESPNFDGYQAVLPQGVVASQAPQWFERICTIAGACAFFKCLYGGGPANPVCIACGSVAVACTVCNLINWLWECP